MNPENLCKNLIVAIALTMLAEGVGIAADATRVGQTTKLPYPTITTLNSSETRELRNQDQPGWITTSEGRFRFKRIGTSNENLLIVVKLKSGLVPINDMRRIDFERKCCNITVYLKDGAQEVANSMDIYGVHDAYISNFGVHGLPFVLISARGGKTYPKSFPNLVGISSIELAGGTMGAVVHHEQVEDKDKSDPGLRAKPGNRDKELAGIMKDLAILKCLDELDVLGPDNSTVDSNQVAASLPNNPLVEALAISSVKRLGLTVNFNNYMNNLRDIYPIPVQRQAVALAATLNDYVSVDNSHHEIPYGVISLQAIILSTKSMSVPDCVFTITASRDGDR